MWGKGDVDVATPALGRRGDVLIAMGGAWGKGDVDVATPAGGRNWIWNGEGVAYRLGFFSPALMGTGSQFWRGGTGQVAKAVKAQGGL